MNERRGESRYADNVKTASDCADVMWNGRSFHIVRLVDVTVRVT